MPCLSIYAYWVGTPSSRTIALVHADHPAFLAKVGLKVHSVTTEVLRREHGKPVTGLVVPKYHGGLGRHGRWRVGLRSVALGILETSPCPPMRALLSSVCLGHKGSACRSDEGRVAGIRHRRAADLAGLLCDQRPSSGSATVAPRGFPPGRSTTERSRSRTRRIMAGEIPILLPNGNLGPLVRGRYA
jgi:hypothetical protein